MATFVFTAGTYTIEDDGIPGNNVAVVRDGDGNFVDSFTYPLDELILLASEPGVNFIINLTDPLGGADFRIGDLNDAAASPDSVVINNVETTGDVTLVSNGAVTEGGADAGADIVAGSIVISAVTGVGAAGAAIETQTSGLEAETDEGGIALTNFGDVTIGGVTADVDGLHVFDSGDLIFTNNGTITLNEDLYSAYSVIEGGYYSGDVTIVAAGANADIIGDDSDAVATFGTGNIVLTAGRDVSLGANDEDTDVRALGGGNVTINAGRDFVTTGDADVTANYSGNVFITAGGNITVSDDNGAGSEISAFNGDVVLTTGAGGALILEYSYYSTPVSSVYGDVTVNADRVIIDANSGIAAYSDGTVTITTVTDARGVDLGSTTDAAFALEISDAEVDRIFTDNLVIGRTDGGRITVSDSVTLGQANATLLSGEDIRINNDLDGLALNLAAAGNVLQIAASNLTANDLVVSVDSPNDDPGTGQSTVFAGFVGTNSTTIRGGPDPDNLGGTNDDDSIIGGVGADIMAGLGGNDTYYADTGNDIVNETAGNGTLDVVFSSVSYALQAGSEIELLSAIDNSATTAIDLTGNELAQVIYGNAGVNVITGGGGADLLIGLGGDDLYNINDDDAVVIENTGGGADVILTSVSYQLGLGVEVEVLGASDSSATTAINLVGNELAQVLYGNNGVNVLVGGSGADTLVGFGGDDVYYVDDAQAAVVEATGGGNDAVLTSVSYTLGAGTEVELLAALDSGATDAIDLTGNELANILYGNAGANTLDGRSGADTLNGLDGADTFAFTTALGGGNVDALADFDATDDTIALDDAVFTALTPGALPAGAFVAGTAAADADDRIVYDGATGNIFYDADGNGAGAAVLFATVQSGTALTASDFTVI